MKVEYLGTGAAEGIPALFCNCEYCRSVRLNGGKEIRSRAQVLLDGELSVDFPPDAFFHAAALGADLSAIGYLLVTHSHLDHFDAASLVLRGYKYARDMSAETLHIFGNGEVLEVFSEATRREMREDVREKIILHAVRAFEPFSCGEWTVHPLKAQHSSRDPLLYLIEKGGKCVLHLTDTGTLPRESLEYLQSLKKRCDLITFDCTFLFGKTEQGARHMGLDENLRVLGRLRSCGVADEKTVCVITHFSHNSRPTKEALEAARGMGFLPAYDGMTVHI